MGEKWKNLNPWIKGIIVFLILGAIGTAIYLIFFRKGTRKWSSQKKQVYKDWAIQNYSEWAFNNPWPELLDIAYARTSPGVFSGGSPEDMRGTETLRVVASENAQWAWDEGTLERDTLNNQYWAGFWRDYMRQNNLNENGFPVGEGETADPFNVYG